MIFFVIIKTTSSVQNCHEVNQNWTLPILELKIVNFHTVWNSNIDKTVTKKKFFRSSLQSCWMQQFSLFPRREGVMHMLSTLQTSYLIARLCEECWGRWGEYFVEQQFRLCLFQFHGKNGSTKSPLKWLVIGWWMDSYFFKRSSEQTRGDFFSPLFSWYASRSGLF